eukprot:COSAG02_NODE_491_length_21224_cov_5.973680_5_plen_193_part_00
MVFGGTWTLCCGHQRASIRAQRELSKRHAEESRIKLQQQNERSDQVVRAWAKKQQNLNKTKNRARRNRIMRDQRFIEDSKAVVAHVRTWDSTPPVELMHASTALAKLKKEEKRAMKEGRTVSGASSGGEDDEPETPAEVQTVMERKASVTVSSSTRALAKSKSLFPLTVVVLSLLFTDRRDEERTRAAAWLV